MATTRDKRLDQAVKPSPDEIQVVIEQARQELGETIEALTAKLDVKTRARNKAGEVKQQVLGAVEQTRRQAVTVTSQARAAATDDEGRPVPAVLVGAVAAALLIGVAAAVTWQRR